jgi:uncharacterized membrane protein YkoI
MYLSSLGISGSALLLLGASVLALVPTIATATKDHNRAKALRDAGEILPLQVILERANQQHRGQLLEAELEDEGGRVFYELELVDETGLVWEIKYDAKTGELVQRERDD